MSQGALICRGTASTRRSLLPHTLAWDVQTGRSHLRQPLVLTSPRNSIMFGSAISSIAPLPLCICMNITKSFKIDDSWRASDACTHGEMTHVSQRDGTCLTRLQNVLLFCNNERLGDTAYPPGIPLGSPDIFNLTF